MGMRAMNPQLNILIGTRGQFVKMAPVLQEMDKRNLPYRLLHTGQHTISTASMAELFGIRKGDIFLTKRKHDIISIREAALWFFQCLFKGFRLSRADRDCEKNAVVTHGDTLSTLIGCILSRMWQQKLIHVESGLTTNHFWTPFPEEIIRRITVRCAHILFAPSQWAKDNLERTNVMGKIVLTEANTVLDSLRYLKAIPKNSKSDIYCVVTLHRNETFYSKNNTERAVALLLSIASEYPVRFVMHCLTEKRLEKYHLLKKIKESDNIQILGYQPYDTFMDMVSKAAFTITDGGGLQEETFYLNVPCFIFRKNTERREGLGASAILLKHNNHILELVKNLDQYRHQETIETCYPSRIIVDRLIELVS